MKQYIIIDHQCSKEKFQIRKDKTTGAWKTWPQVKKNHASKYYKHQAYMPYKIKPKSLFDVFYGLARRTNNRIKIRHISTRKSKGNMFLHSGEKRFFFSGGSKHRKNRLKGKIWNKKYNHAKAGKMWQG